MHVNERFMQFALLGAEWVLWLLIALSVVSIGVALERWLTYRNAHRRQLALDTHARFAWQRCQQGQSLEAIHELREVSQSASGPAADLMRGTLEAASAGSDAIDAIQEATSSSHRVRFERGLSILGSVGSNAPFVGLFGTVLEILRVFNAIGGGGIAKAERAAQIMSGISEALVATAVGLLVAIPAVVAYNVLTRRLDEIMSGAQEVGQLTRASVLFHFANERGRQHGR